MRTMAGTVFAVVLASASAPASAEVGIGIVGGVNIATFKMSEDDPDVSFDSKAFPAGGIVLDVGLSDAVALRFEPMYMTKGAKFGLDDFFGEDLRGSLALTFVELPVLLKVSRSSGTVRPYLVAGPSLGYRTKATVKDELTGEEEEPEDADEVFEKWDLGVAAGGGLSFAAGRSTIFAEGRYTWALKDINKDETEEVALKNRGVQVLVGFTFGGGR